MMKKLLQAVFLVLLAVAVIKVSAMAPGDHDLDCRTGTNMQNHIFPENWKVLMDTYDYQNLFDPSGSGTPVWRQDNFDDDNHGWSQIVGGACTWSLYTCTFPFGPQDNWLFSQYISYGDAQEVFFNVSFRFTSCRDTPICSDDFVTVYRYDVDGPVSPSARTNPDNYVPLQGTEESSRLEQLPSPVREVMRTLSMSRPEPATNGFYLALKDSGTCGEVNRLITYYTVCQERQKELVLYPEVGTPPQDGEDQVFEAKCVENAHNVTSLQVTAFSENSTCRDVAVGGVRCDCNGGYHISQERDSCNECPAGTYRFPGLSSTCQDCPANTELGAMAASSCSCLPGFFRTVHEGPNVGCTAPPDAVTDLSADLEAATSNSITVSWKPPKETGRDDFYYEVLVAEMATQEVVFVGVTTTTADPVVYTVEGLRSFTNHTVTVITHNGVSDQDAINQAKRQVQVRAATTEGVPGAPQVTSLCTVVIWKPPTNPSGLIVAYEARFAQSDDKIVRVNADTNFIITEDEQRSGNVMVEMRAINSFASGPWSAPLPLNCTSQTTDCPGTTVPTTTAASCLAPANGAVVVEYSCDDGFVLVGDAMRMCQDDGSWDGSVPSCVSECQTQPPHFTLNGVQVANGSALNILSIEVEDNALLAETPYEDCCRSQRIGECYYPDGTQVGIRNAGQVFYRNRENGFVRLNRVPNPVEDYPLGTYRCEVPDGCGTFVPLYVTLELE